MGRNILGSLTEGPMRILLVDDADDIRLSTKLLLELYGHRVDCAKNGAEAVVLALRYPPDAILMDISMPMLNGFEAMRTLRKLPETQAVPILALSAYLADQAARDRALAAGADACLEKPVSYELLSDFLLRCAK